MRLIDAISLLDNHTKTIRVRGKLIGYVTFEDISDAPTVDAEPVRHGQWLKLKDINGFFVRCSVCLEAYGEETNYCPNCGAKMDEEVTDG